MRILARRPRLALFLAGSLLFAGASIAQPTAPLSTLEVAIPKPDIPPVKRVDLPATGLPQIDMALPKPPQANLPPADLSVMTYNVKGLPWPIATGRAAALERIADRLAWMRKGGVQPAVVVLQEAFRSEAKEIGDRAGYRFQIGGENISRAASPVSKRSPFRRRASAPQLDSGLVVLSDYPILDVNRASFPESACAGIDCYAAKGVVLVTLALPGKGRIEVATTHLNSKGASWASEKETERAYREQVDFLVEFLADKRDHSVPLVLAGDFNLGNRAERLAILPPALLGLNGGNAPAEPLRHFVEAADTHLARSKDAQWVVERARDMQYVLPGSGRTLAPVAASIPFGSETRGEPLSDHFGYTIEYRLTQSDGSLIESRIAAREE